MFATTVLLTLRFYIGFHSKIAILAPVALNLSSQRFKNHVRSEVSKVATTERIEPLLGSQESVVPITDRSAQRFASYECFKVQPSCSSHPLYSKVA